MAILDDEVETFDQKLSRLLYQANDNEANGFLQFAENNHLERIQVVLSAQDNSKYGN